jgi:hypothetical protein
MAVGCVTCPLVHVFFGADAEQKNGFLHDGVLFFQTKRRVETQAPAIPPRSSE